MIVIAGEFQADPGRRSEAIDLMNWISDACETEPGCRRYRFYATLNDDYRFLLFEEWESEEALARHFETEHLRQFRERRANLLTAVAITRYEVSSAGPL